MLGLTGAGGLRWTRTGAVLFSTHVGLLFFPPLPPFWKGSLWSYVLGYVAVACVLKDSASWGPRLIDHWRSLSPVARALRGTVAVALFGLAGFLLREWSSDLFARFSREEGVWEPVSLAMFVGSALLLFRTADTLAEAPRRHVRLVAFGFVILSLEEIDYFGIFGSVIGRIDGIYTGSLHDIIRLAEAGLIGVGTWAILMMTASAFTTILYRRDYLQPRRLWSLIRSFQGIWLLAGMGFLMLAGAQEASMFGVNFALPNPEELIESIGGLCLGLFTLEVAAAEIEAGSATQASPPFQDVTRLRGHVG